MENNEHAKALTDDEIRTLLDEALRIQSENYGNGSETHMKLSTWADKARALLATQPSAEPIEQTGDVCTHAGMFATDNETGFVTCVGCGELAPVNKPSAPDDATHKNGDLIDWDRISEAAKQACNEYGQWMPERWLQLFVNAYNRKKS